MKPPPSEPDSASTDFLKGTWLVAGAPIWVPLFFVEEFRDEHKRNKASVFWRACGAKITDALKQMPSREWHQDCACVVFPLEVEKETLPRGFTPTTATAPDGLEEQALCRNDRAVIYALKWAHDEAPTECKHTMHQTCDSVVARFGDY